MMELHNTSNESHCTSHTLFEQKKLFDALYEHLPKFSPFYRNCCKMADRKCTSHHTHLLPSVHPLLERKRSFDISDPQDGFGYDARRHILHSLPRIRQHCAGEMDVARSLHWNSYLVSAMMAALVKHGVFKTSPLLPTKNVMVLRGYATKAEKRKGIDKRPVPKIEATAQSLATKGFLRAQKEYFPPQDVQAKLSSIIKRVLGNQVVIKDDVKVTNLKDRFALFTACEKEFNHYIPNPYLHEVQTLGDLVEFYTTPIDLMTPLDKMRNMDLPENLHIQFEYHRFHPDTDTLFNGLTAFNESSTIVTGLKSKKKYEGHKQTIKYPHL